MVCEKALAFLPLERTLNLSFHSGTWVTCVSFQTDQCSFDVQWKYTFQIKGFYRIAVCEWCAKYVHLS